MNTVFTVAALFAAVVPPPTSSASLSMSFLACLPSSVAVPSLGVAAVVGEHTALTVVGDDPLSLFWLARLAAPLSLLASLGGHCMACAVVPSRFGRVRPARCSGPAPSGRGSSVPGGSRSCTSLGTAAGLISVLARIDPRGYRGWCRHRRRRSPPSPSSPSSWSS